MKHLNHNIIKTKNYYNHLFTFFAFVSFLLTLTLVKFYINDFLLFLLKFIILFFLLMVISVMLEFIQRGEYISPITFYNLEEFFNQFLREVGNDGDFEKFFNKYDSKSKKTFLSIFKKNKKNFFLSSIKKNKNVYQLTIIDEIKVFQFLIFKFLVKKAVHKLYVKKIDRKFKIIRII